MSRLNKFLSKIPIFSKSEKKSSEDVIGMKVESNISTNFSTYSGVSYNPILVDVFDGEKSQGELGAVYDTLPDHLKLRLRAYDANLKTDIIKIITGKFFKWVVGSGLKLQSEPNETVLEMFGATEDFSKFKRECEALFNVYSSSDYSDYSEQDDLHQKAYEAFSCAFLGGDVLCILRLDEVGPNIQVIDGQRVEDPLLDAKKDEGNKIHHGVEVDKRGKHVAYWVKKEKDDGSIEHKRVKARNENGNLVAWMIYGDKHRIDHYRGIPKISSILEKVDKLDRFVEASVKKAEETANVIYAFKHNTNSTGENILTESLVSKKNNGDGVKEDIFEKNGKIANNFKQSVNGQVLNLTPDSDLTALSTENETTFENFFRAVFVCLAASVDMPEEVALQKYEQSYSSSRAAINGWEHLVEIYRKKMVSKKFYQPFYRFWLEWCILTDKIKSNGFLKARFNGDLLTVEAYFGARFTGKKMPHIDPLKEAKAIRTMLGEDKTPLISREQGAELLGVGDYNENIKKLSEEETSLPDNLKPKPEENAQIKNDAE